MPETGTKLRIPASLLSAALLAVSLAGCASEQAPEPPSERAETMTEAPRLSGDQLDDALATPDLFLLDVRQPEEIAEIGTVDGYVNIPLGELADRLDELPKDRPILTA